MRTLVYLLLTVFLVLLSRPAPSAGMPHCNCTFNSCEGLRSLPKRCQYGEGRDPCDCCRVCLKGPEEPCGPNQTKCGKVGKVGLFCKLDHLSRSGRDQGVCKPGPRSRSRQQRRA